MKYWHRKSLTFPVRVTALYMWSDGNAMMKTTTTKAKKSVSLSYLHIPKVLLRVEHRNLRRRRKGEVRTWWLIVVKCTAGGSVFPNGLSQDDSHLKSKKCLLNAGQFSPRAYIYGNNLFLVFTGSQDFVF